jgi:hypothetical protein
VGLRHLLGIVFLDSRDIERHLQWREWIA